MRQRILTFLSILIFASSANAQLLDGLETVLLAKEDAQKLLQGYTNPLAKSFIYGINTGWAHTAKTHKQLGFDITIGAGLSAAPDADLSFSPENLSYVNAPSQGLPTIFSDSDVVPLDIVIPASGDLEELRATLEFPGGVGNVLPITGLPIPVLQASIGAVLNTDIIVRYVPETEIEGTSVSLHGFGLKHDLTQYLGPIDNLPFNLSILAAQTYVSSRYNIEATTLSQNPAADIRYVDFNVKAQTVQLLGSLDFPLISVFGAIGISRGSADLGMKGVYELEYQQQTGGLDVATTISITDPISLNYSANSTLATIGARLNLAILKIYAQYSLQEYQTAAVGVSLGLR
jgi:hypothetical protein